MISALSTFKPILYIDMDNVLVDFQSGINKLSEYEKKEYEGRYDEVPNIFAKMYPSLIPQHFDLTLFISS